jgi:hypothetical protein
MQDIENMGFGRHPGIKGKLDRAMPIWPECCCSGDGNVAAVEGSEISTFAKTGNADGSAVGRTPVSSPDIAFCRQT